jgi:hypothetical protein
MLHSLRHPLFVNPEARQNLGSGQQPVLLCRLLLMRLLSVSRKSGLYSQIQVHYWRPMLHSGKGELLGQVTALPETMDSQLLFVAGVPNSRRCRMQLAEVLAGEQSMRNGECVFSSNLASLSHTTSN